MSPPPKPMIEPKILSQSYVIYLGTKGNYSDYTVKMVTQYQAWPGKPASQERV